MKHNKQSKRVIQKGCSNRKKTRKQRRKRTVKKAPIFIGGSAPWVASPLTPANSVNSSGGNVGSAANHYALSPYGVSPTFIMPQSANALAEAQAGIISGGAAARRSMRRKMRRQRMRSIRGGGAPLSYLHPDIANVISGGLDNLTRMTSGLRGDPVPPLSSSPLEQPIAHSTPLML